MADNKKFWEGLEGAAKLGGLSLIAFLVFRSRAGRRAARQLQRLLKVSGDRVVIEGDEVLQQIMRFSREEIDRVLSHGVAGAVVVAAFGTLCMFGAALIPSWFATDPLTVEAARRGAIVEGLVLSTILLGIMLAIHMILWAVIPIWAIATTIIEGSKKAGELELSKAGLKKAPAWFFGSLTAIGGGVADQLGALYRWMTRLVGWISIGAGYLWVLPCHRAPELLAGLGIPVISIFYTFNQGWRSEKKYEERGSVWKAIVISTALVLLNMAVLWTFPEYYELLLVGQLVPRLIYWGLILIQLAMVYGWSTVSSSESTGSSGVRPQASMSYNWVIGLVLIVIAGLVIYLQVGPKLPK